MIQNEYSSLVTASLPDSSPSHKENYVNEWYHRKWMVILLHALAWTALFSLPFLIRISNADSPPPEKSFFNFYMTTRVFWIGFFYLNSYVLLPRFIAKRRYLLYVLSQIIVILLLSFVHFVFFNFFIKATSYDLAGFLMFNTFTYLFILSASIAYRLINEKINNDKLFQQRENENLKTELSFLRSQVSPHFMFNVLNNMVALARKHSDQLEPSLIKLSSLMRYMLYETNEEDVSLEKEIEYLESYIDLQVQRFGKKLIVNTNFPDIKGAYYIEPMLLIPFVENAFKHGTGRIENPQIDIDLKVENKVLYFTVKNKYNENGESKDKTSGIGLSNVERRLDLLYNGTHQLNMQKNNGWFLVSLQLKLH